MTFKRVFLCMNIYIYMHIYIYIDTSVWVVPRIEEDSASRPCARWSCMIMSCTIAKHAHKVGSLPFNTDCPFV